MTTADQTAYSSARRARLRNADRLTGWDPKIVDLFNLGHDFLSCKYSEPGWLYRGGSNALTNVLKTGKIGHFDGEKSVTQLERELGIFLISQDFSDSYSVARFWEGIRGSYIAVFKSACFNRELRAGRAAVLGFAESGVVFKYPFLTQPLALSDIDYLIVSPEDHGVLNAADAERPSVAGQDRLATERRHEYQITISTKIISPAIDPEAARYRAVFEKGVVELFENLGIESAISLPSPKFPQAG